MELTRQELLSIIRERLHAAEDTATSDTLRQIADLLHPKRTSPRIVRIAAWAEGRIKTIKVIREYTGLGLAEAKNVTEQATPLMINLGGYVGARNTDAHAFAEALIRAGTNAEAI